MPTLDLIIVNWNAGAQLHTCLKAVAAAERTSFGFGQVVVVDNASADGSLVGLDALPLPLTVLRNASNRGFAAACNQGASVCRGDYLLFLNPDTRVSPESLARCIAFLEAPQNRWVGLLGAQLVDDSGAVSRSCARFPRLRHFAARMTGLDRLAPRLFPSLLMTEWDHAESRTVDHVTGAFYLTRRSIFDALGGFDERFFVYLEDLDYGLRIKQAGWDTYFLADARVYHKGCGTSDRVKGTRLFYMLRSQIRYGFKHFSLPGAALHLAGIFTVEFTARMARGLARRSPEEIGATLEAYRLLLGALPGLFRSRADTPQRNAAPRSQSVAPAERV